MNFHCAYREAVLIEKHKSPNVSFDQQWLNRWGLDRNFHLILFWVWFFIVYTYLFKLLYSFQNRWNKEILSGWLDILGKLEKLEHT